MSKDLLDPEVLNDQEEGLNEEQRDAIRTRALDDAKKREKEGVSDEDEDDPFKAPLGKKGKKEDVEPPVETEDEKKAREDKEATAAKEKEDAEAKEAETERVKTLEIAKAKEEKDLTDEDKALIAEDGEAQKKDREGEIGKYADAYAEKFGLTADQAKREVEKIYGMLDKYKGEPREMAQAVYHLTAKLTKATEELSTIKNAPKGKQISIKGKAMSEEDTKDFLVGKYKEFYKEKIPGLEEMSEEAVFALAWKEYEERYKLSLNDAHKGMKDKAEGKRREVLEKGIPEEDKKFLKDIRGALYRVDDTEVLSEDFDVLDYVYWARGKNYHKDVKAATEKAVAEAMKNKKILGTQGGASGAGSGAPAKKGSGSSLTDTEKDRALDMYASAKITDEEKFKLYQNFKERVTKKKE